MDAEKAAHELVAEPPADFRLHEPVFPLSVVGKVPAVIVGGNIHCPFRCKGELDAGIDSSRRIVEDICLERHILAFGRTDGKRKETDYKCCHAFDRTLTKIIIHISLSCSPLWALKSPTIFVTKKRRPFLISALVPRNGLFSNRTRQRIGCFIFFRVEV